MCVSVCVQVPEEAGEGRWVFSELELQVIVRHRTRMLGAELRSSGRAGSILNG